MQFQNFEAASRKPNMKPFGLMAEFQDLSWIASNYSDFQLQTVSGIVNGSNRIFTIPAAPGNGIIVFVNGIGTFAGTAFTLAGTTITFLPGWVPQPGDVVDAALTW